MPGLTIFSATLRRTGSVCSAMKTTPKPPSPICSRSLYAPMTVPGPSLSGASPTLAPTSGGSRSSGPCTSSWADSSSFKRPSNSGWLAHVSSRYACRCLASGRAMAATKMAFSSMAINRSFCLSKDSAESERESHQKIASSEDRGGLFRSLTGGMLFQRCVQPGAGIGPRAVRRAGGDAESFRGLGNRQSGEIAQLDDLRRHGVDALESFQRLMDREQVHRRLGRLDLLIFKVVALQVAAPTQR